MSRLTVFLPGVAIVAGIFLVLAGALADVFSWGRPGGVGVGQVLLMLIGVSLVLAGILKKRIVPLYKAAALVAVNTLVLLLCLEALAIVVARAWTPRESWADLPFYAAQPWSEAYWGEARRAESYAYEPFVGWRHQPFRGELVNIDSEGMRMTPGAECSEAVYEVWAFGGSTMWGWGSPDGSTIAAHLQGSLSDWLGRPACVRNMAEDAFVSTQGLIRLTRLLQAGESPDAVVFYDGVNDIFAAFESGQAGVHPQLRQVAARFEERGNPLIMWIQRTRFFSMMQRVVRGEEPIGGGTKRTSTHFRTMGVADEELSRRVVDAYLGVYDLVGALADTFGFESYFFWQPHLAIDDKNLTPEEEETLAGMHPALRDLARAVYGLVVPEAEARARLWDLSDVFHSRDEPIWIDEWGHVTPEGNRLVAERISATLQAQAGSEVLEADSESESNGRS